MVKRVECIVRGDVQGVSYRAFVKETARGLGLVGFVRNLPDEAVEIIAEGEEAGLHALFAAIRSEHPFAKVLRVDEAWGEPTGEFTDFRIIR